MGISKPQRRAALVVTAALITAAATSGCGGSSKTSSSAKASAEIPASSILKAADVSSAAAGFKVALTEHIVTGGKSIDATATGSYTPAAHQADLNMSLALPASEGGAAQIEVVLDQGVMYFKLPPNLASQSPGGKAWLSISLDQVGKLAGIPGLGSLVNDGSSLDDPTQYLDFLHATADGTVKDLGQESVNGIPTTHYQAEVDFTKLPDAMPAADKASMQQLVDELSKKAQIPEFPVDVWIDDSHLVRKLQENLTETVSGKQVTVGITENFLDYGPQPAPTVPSADQTVDLASLLPAGSN